MILLRDLVGIQIRMLEDTGKKPGETGVRIVEGNKGKGRSMKKTGI